MDNIRVPQDITNALFQIENALTEVSELLYDREYIAVNINKNIERITHIDIHVNMDNEELSEVASIALNITDELEILNTQYNSATIDLFNSSYKLSELLFSIIPYYNPHTLEDSASFHDLMLYNSRIINEYILENDSQIYIEKLEYIKKLSEDISIELIPTNTNIKIQDLKVFENKIGNNYCQKRTHILDIQANKNELLRSTGKFRIKHCSILLNMLQELLAAKKIELFNSYSQDDNSITKLSSAIQTFETHLFDKDLSLIATSILHKLQTELEEIPDIKNEVAVILNSIEFNNIKQSLFDNDKQYTEELDSLLKYANNAESSITSIQDINDSINIVKDSLNHIDPSILVPITRSAGLTNDYSNDIFRDENTTISAPHSDSSAEPYSGSIPEPHYDSSSEPYYDSSPEPHYDSISEPHYDSSSEPYYDSISEPYYDSSPEPHYDSSPEPHYDSSSEPHYDSSSEPYYDSISEPYYDSSPVPYYDSSPEPHYDSSSEPYYDSSPVPYYDSSPEPHYDSSSEPYYDSSAVAYSAFNKLPIVPVNAPIVNMSIFLPNLIDDVVPRLAAIMEPILYDNDYDSSLPEIFPIRTLSSFTSNFYDDTIIPEIFPIR